MRLHLSLRCVLWLLSVFITGHLIVNFFILESRQPALIFKQNDKVSFKTRHQTVKIGFKPFLNETSPVVYSVHDIREYNEFTYETFHQKIPNFISEDDRKKFFAVEINKELMRPVSKDKLLGVVRVIKDGEFSLPYNCGWKSSNTSWMKQSNYHDVSTDILCPLIIPDGWAFQSFMDSTLPKIMQVYELLLHPSIKIVLEQPRDIIIHEILNKLGIRKEQIIFQNPHKNIVYHAKYMLFTCIAPPLHPDLWKRARGVLGVSDALHIARKDAHIILLSRKWANNPGRKITNENDVLTMLRNRYGNNRVFLFDGSYNLKLSIEYFKNASLIIGVHGGAFYNMYFAPRNTTLIEISPCDKQGLPVPRSLGHAIFWTMSTLLNQIYWRIYHITTHFTSNIQVNVTVLESVLDEVDKQWRNEIGTL